MVGASGVIHGVLVEKLATDAQNAAVSPVEFAATSVFALAISDHGVVANGEVENTHVDVVALSAA